MKPIKKVHRAERKNSKCRAVTLSCPQGMVEVAKKDGNNQFIPAADYELLWKKYIWLVKRRRKELDSRR